MQYFLVKPNIQFLLYIAATTSLTHLPCCAHFKIRIANQWELSVPLHQLPVNRILYTPIYLFDFYSLILFGIYQDILKMTNVDIRALSGSCLLALSQNDLVCICIMCTILFMNSLDFFCPTLFYFIFSYTCCGVHFTHTYS